MKYSKISLVSLILSCILLISWVFVEGGTNYYLRDTLIFCWPFLFIVAIIFAAIGRVKEKTLFTGMMLAISFTVPLSLLLVGYILIARGFSRTW